MIKIKDKMYIGQDSHVFMNHRLKQHLNDLRHGLHYNTEMQNDFDEYGENSITYTILDFSDTYTHEELNMLEAYYIEKYNTFKSNNGYNETGGKGAKGVKIPQNVLEKRGKKISGENNGNSKITNDQFYEIVELFKQHKTNEEIALLYNLHPRYVSLIRHKRRFKRLWKDINYEPEVSPAGKNKRRLSYDDFLDIMNMIDDGLNNADIQRKYGFASGTGSRIRHRKLYCDYWERFTKENK